MAPAFWGGLRKSSRNSRKNSSGDLTTSNDSGAGPPQANGSANSHLTINKSSSTLNSYVAGSQTPITPLESSNSSLSTPSTNHLQAQPSHSRPQSLVKRYSVGGMSGLGSPTLTDGTSLPVSPYAPRITSIMNNTFVSAQ
jgi:hypothetical protein